MTERILGALLLIGLVAAPAAAEDPAARETADEDVDRAITAVKRYLWGQQRADGGWPQIRHYAHSYNVPGGLCTALVTFALLEAGEDFVNSEKMKKGLESLTKLKSDNIQVRAFRVMALSRVVGANRDSPHLASLKEDIKWLLRSRGAWGPGGPHRVGDNSSNQYAMMALWEATAAGAELPKKLLAAAERVWVKNQRPDGGWAFSDLETTELKSTPRMTAAGLASM